jgi:hypothetical protein
LLLYGTHNYDQVKYIKHILKSKCGPLNKDEEALQFLECKGKKQISLRTGNFENLFMMFLVSLTSNWNGCFSTGRKKTLVKSQNSPVLLTNVVQLP